MRIHGVHDRSGANVGAARRRLRAPVGLERAGLDPALGRLREPEHGLDVQVAVTGAWGSPRADSLDGVHPNREGQMDPTGRVRS